MVSCRWGRDCIEYLHSHSMCVCIRMWRQSSCWILDVHMCMRSLIWHSYLPSHQLSEMQTQVRTRLTCRGAFYSIYITAQLYHTTYYTVVSLTLHWGFFFLSVFISSTSFSPPTVMETQHTHMTTPHRGKAAFSIDLCLARMWYSAKVSSHQQAAWGGRASWKVQTART